MSHHHHHGHTEQGFAAPEQTRDYNADAENLHKALEGFFSHDDAALIALIGERSRSELHEIDQAYRLKYGKPLADKLKSETSGHYERVLVNVVQPPPVTDAIYLHDALSEMFTEDSVLDEILTTRDGADIEQIKLAYTEVFRQGLEHKLKWDTHGAYEDLLLTLLNGPRRSSGGVEMSKASADAEHLFASPTEATFTSVLGNAGHDHVLAIRDSFQERYGIPLVEHIHKTHSGHFAKALEALVTPRAEYFAERLHKAISGLITDDERLIRVITTRYGVDLHEIKEAYAQKYNKTLFDAVTHDTSGNYKKILLELIGTAA